MFKTIPYVLTIVLSAVVLGACSKQAPEPDPVLVKGKAIYTGTCKACHAQAINGAPIPGNQKMWGPRAKQGLEVLVKHASEGYGLMPARGGNDALTQEDLEAAITFMLSQLDNKSG